MHSHTFQYPLTIKETHLDTFGHVNNATYLVLFEEARWEIISNRDYGLEKIKETGLGPTILDIKIRYAKELKARDKVVIETRTASYVRKIGKIIQEIWRGDEVCCTAEFTMGLFDIKARKLVLPTADWLKALGLL